ncbi:MAG: hypothetical protein JXB47_21230 [Anaerolineae bacterium]|nr:hypothetical protein [Anaerolineae bacterium]
MGINKTDLSPNARLVLKDLNMQFDAINRNPVSIRLRLQRDHGLSAVQVAAALDELVQVRLAQREVDWYNLTPMGHMVARSRTGPLPVQ